MKPQRLDIGYRIAWNGRWHVGSGYGSAAVDRLQQRLGGAGAPFVPGSQVKGVLRHQCERLALALGLEAVDPHAGAGEGDRSLVEHFQPLAKSTLLIDRLFGSRYQGECVFVTNAVPGKGGEGNAAKPAVAARTAIDRVTGTVMERHLFTTELIEADVELQGAIRARHPGGVLTQEDEGLPYEYALLVAGLLSLDTLGGDKSTGLGRCEVRIESLRWNGENMSPEAALTSFEEREWADMIEMLREMTA